ncbi:MAG: hypothetical protein GX322_07665 [Firmicutes bacterium]|nr:hypothetical protein [Bacillota bacterium]
MLREGAGLGTMEVVSRASRQGLWLVGGILFLIMLLGVFGQGPLLAAGNDINGQDGTDKDLIKIRIHTDAPEAQAGIFDLKRKVAVIEPPNGYVEVLAKDSQLTAKKMTYNQGDDTAELSGDVTVIREDMNAMAANMHVDFDQETYILEGDVYLKQLKTETQGEVKTRLEVWSAWMQAQEGAKHILARGNVHLVEPERQAWADELDYDDEEEIAVLTGDVRIETDDGSVLTGAKVVINLSNDEAVVYGPTYAEFILEQDSDAAEAP